MTVTTEDAAPWNGTKDNKAHLSHLMSRMDSDLSFNNDDVDEQALKPDAIHRSVSREAWYKVRLQQAKRSIEICCCFRCWSFASSNRI